MTPSRTAPNASTDRTVAVFGGTGKAGRHLVEQALAAGHRVTMLARTPGKVDVQHERLRIVEGDVVDPVAVAKTIEGATAVLSTLGPTKNTPDHQVSRGMAHILEDMSRTVHAVRASDRDWTVVRVPMLTDGPPTGSVRVGDVGVNTGPRIARADLARFMLEQLDDPAHVRASPVVSAPA